MAVLKVAAAAAAFVLLLGGTALADTVQISDDAHVLSAAQVTEVRGAAAALPDPVEIFTSTDSADDTAAFDDRYAVRLETAPTDVVIYGINPRSGRVTLQAGSHSGVSDRISTDAVNAFVAVTRTDGSYAAALTASLRTLRAELPAHPAGESHQSKGFGVVGVVFAVVVAGIVIVVVQRVVRSGRGRPVPPGRGFGRRPSYDPAPMEHHGGDGRARP